VGQLIVASNTNKVLTDFIETGTYDRRRDFVKTISPSMDILVSSNLERLLYYLTDGDCERVSAWMSDLSSTGVYTLPADIMERMRDKWNCYDFQHFINGIKKENPRHISKQLSAIEQFLDSEKPERALVAEVMRICCKNFRYQFSQFKVVYEYTKAGRSFSGTENMTVAMKSDPVDYKSLEIYGRVFNERVAQTRKEATV
jgi:hypothetical protein